MRFVILAVTSVVLLLGAISANAQPMLDTGFTYQGVLKLSNQVVNDTADFEFTLYDAPVGGNAIGSKVTVNEVAIENGLFTVKLDFGVAVFNGEDRWLETSVRSPSGNGAFNQLAPRQPLTATPYALQTRGIFVDDQGLISVGNGARDFKIREVLPGDSGWQELIYLGGIGIGSLTGNNQQMVMFTDGFGDEPIFTVASTLDAGGTWNPALAVLQGGNVGIGNNAPTHKLHVSGDIKCQSITLDAGADLSEGFQVAETSTPGMLVVIDPERPGELRLAREPYDARVAGIISGAGGVHPGVLMGQAGSIASGETPVALTGRVYCWVDADVNGPVKPGDMLTTSPTPGHAMHATDRDRAFGATIGKAMTSLESGRGLVLVLVSLH